MKNKSLFVLMLLLLLVTLGHTAIVVLVNENFEGAWAPAGWDIDSTVRSTDFAHSPTRSVKFDAASDFLRTPLLVKPWMMSFWHRWLSSSDPTQFWVQIRTSTTSTWTTLGNYWAGNGWTKVTIDLTPYKLSSVYVRFVLNVSSPSPECVTRLYIDDVYVERDDRDDNVPVELASFTANVVHQNDQDMVQINWTTHTETQVSGYYIFRNDHMDSANALQLNAGLIEATNSSNSTNYTFVDNETQPGTLYYWLQSNDMSGAVQLFGPISVNIGSNNQTTTGAGIASKINDIYPNPFNLKAVIPIQLTSKGDLKLEIYNQKGQLVWTHSKNNADGGLYKIEWNGRDMNGKPLTAGVYLCRMTSDNYLGTKKVILMK